MNKKLIISKTILFIFIISFIIGFKKIFGEENTLIGVTVITAALMLLGEDLTTSTFKYFMYFFTINIFLGVSSFIASTNLWVGIPINFISMFLIGFLFCYDIKSNLYIPFGLQYLFMLSMPITQDKIFYRLLSLAFGALFIVVVQLICNRNKMIKNCNKIIDEVIQKILYKVDSVEKNAFDFDIDKDIENIIKKINKFVYSKRKSGFYLTEYGRINLNIAFVLKNINLYLNKLQDYNYMSSIKKVYTIILSINESKKDLQSINKIKSEIQQDLKYKKDEEDPNLTRLLISLDILCDYFIKLCNLENKNYININQNVPDEFNSINILKRNLNTRSLRFSYAFRVAICTTLAIFIMDYFKIYEARWMGYTVFAIVQPYAEHSKPKSFHRMKGTLIGGIIFVVLFTIFKNPFVRSIIVIGAGYIDGYNTTYDKKMICVTISALGTAVITSSIGVVLVYRVLFVVLGVVVALLGNKFILPYTLKDSSENLMRMSDSVIEKLLEEVKLYISKGNNNHTIENLFMIHSLIEDKFKLNKLHYYIKSYEEHFKGKKKVINNVYQVYIMAEHGINADDKFKKVLNDMGNSKEFSY